MRDVRVVVIGAGFAGICVALRLREAGHRNVVIYERASSVGGGTAVITDNAFDVIVFARGFETTSPHAYYGLSVLG